MKKEQTLLEIAKQRKIGGSKIPITPDVIELAVAWARGEVVLAQVSAALGLPPGGVSIYVRMAKALAAYVRGLKP